MLAINNIDIMQDCGGGIQSGNFNIIAPVLVRFRIAIPISLVVVTGKRTFSETATEQPSHY